ncbi:Mur ligase family protein [Alphaproteobacteria bacterium endosymbiont of Tiliacea citrago]|uniref:Mur ligase family protein n=1 Tax=Alphaproteobacteria bacterium endosymbiont of Tiliacea citrago TaxID=3077944 RepID=UPI00313C9E97
MIWPSNSLFFEHPDIFGVSFDSRLVKKGDLFIALKGENFDGHDFVEEALKNGASCALVEKKICENNIVVGSCLNSFVQIAKYRRSLFKGQIVGITGSVGKSTFRYSLVKSLFSQFKVEAPIKNYNTLIGISYFLSQINLESDFLIIELGIEMIGEMQKISSLVIPDYSFLTNVSTAHSYYLGSLFSILNEKSVIFEHTKKCAFFIDNIWYSDYLRNSLNGQGLKFRTFKFNEDSRLLLKNAALELFDELKIDTTFVVDELVGRRDVFSFEKNGYQFSIIDSSYNANISSMINDLNFFKSFSKNKKIAILGDMFGYSQRHHEYLSLYASFVDECWLVGENMRALSKILPKNMFFDSVEDLINYVHSFFRDPPFACDMFIKGSNRVGLTRLVQEIRSLSKLVLDV